MARQSRHIRPVVSYRLPVTSTVFSGRRRDPNRGDSTPVFINNRPVH